MTKHLEYLDLEQIRVSTMRDLDNGSLKDTGEFRKFKIKPYPLDEPTIEPTIIHSILKEDFKNCIRCGGVNLNLESVCFSCKIKGGML